MASGTRITRRTNPPRTLTVGSVRLTWDLDKLVLTNVTALVKRYYDFTADYTEYQDWAFFGNPYPLTGAADDYGYGWYGIHQDDLTQEFRVASNREGAGAGSRAYSCPTRSSTTSRT